LSTTQQLHRRFLLSSHSFQRMALTAKKALLHFCSYPGFLFLFRISVLIRDLTGNSRATIEPMLLAMFVMRVLEVMFFVGLVGSSVVVLISFVEDGKELFGKDE
jgi:hypothetical protein